VRCWNFSRDSKNSFRLDGKISIGYEIRARRVDSKRRIIMLKRIFTVLMALPIILLPGVAFAEAPSYDTIFEAVTTDAQAGIVALLPKVLTIFSIVLVITLGIKLFRRVAGR